MTPADAVRKLAEWRANTKVMYTHVPVYSEAIQAEQEWAATEYVRMVSTQAAGLRAGGEAYGIDGDRYYQGTAEDVATRAVAQAHALIERITETGGTK